MPFYACIRISETTSKQKGDNTIHWQKLQESAAMLAFFCEGALSSYNL